MSDLLLAGRRNRAWACYDCGKCTATCPIARVGGDCSPRRDVLSACSDAHPPGANGGSLRTCLTCGLCGIRCPARVDYNHLLRDLRAQVHQDGMQPDCPHGGALQSIMRMMAAGGTRQNRLAWLRDGLDAAPERGKIFLWTGCAVYYDAIFPKMKHPAIEGPRSALRLLNLLGEVPVVSAEERCCGHDLLWSGDRAGFERLARHNLDLVRESGAEVLVTPCAECLRTWRLDYEEQRGGPRLRILHVAEYLAERIPDLPRRTAERRAVTFQDPCRLSRHLGCQDPPRDLLRAIPGVVLSEMRRSRAAAICCAGGTWSHCDRYAKKIQAERLREARATGAEILVTACPKCQIHFECAMEDPNLPADARMEVRDIAAIAADVFACE